MTPEKQGGPFPCARLLVAAVYLAAAAFSEYWLGALTRHPFGDDFRIYFDAYEKAVAGGNPYLPYSVGESFLYHPFALTFVGLFSWRGEAAARLCWTVASLAAWAASILMAWRLATEGERGAGSGATFAFVFLAFAPFLETLHIGQINCFVVFFLCAAFYLADSQSIAAGACLALAVIFKLSPIVLLLYFAAVSKRRVVVATSVFLLALSAASALQFRAPVMADFLGILPMLSTEMHPSKYNESVLGILVRGCESLGWYQIGPLLALAHKAVFAAVLALLVAAGRAFRRRSRALRFRLYAASVAVMAFFSPLVWYHHSTLFLLPIAALMVDSRSWVVAGTAVAVLAIQSNRIFEQFVAPVALPVLAGHLLVVGLALVTLLADWAGIRGEVRTLPAAAG